MRNSTADSLIGVGVALLLMAAWLASLALWLTRDLADVPVALIAGGMAVQTFLHTGLFITAHDAMHRNVCPASRRINDALGRLATWLYALFSYRRLRAKHGRHHHHPVSGDDPDFHDDGHDRLLPWYVGFMREYVTGWQLFGMAVLYNVLLHGLGVAPANLNLLWVAPALASTVQLFYFGTYLPHRRPEGGYTDEHRASTNAYSPWLSFLTCYHFGYHWEHHQRPDVPWWRLPAVRRDHQSS
jgi:beta-carotene/zeaxanthin 4-ketolase